MTDHTPTPRTDELARELQRINASDWKIDLLALAQTLERELGDLHDEIGSLSYQIEEQKRSLAKGMFLDEETRMCLKGYLLGHEVDIAMDINDYGDLAPPFEALFGRKPGAPK